MGSSTGSSRALSTTRTRRPAVPGRKHLAGAIAMVVVGSFLPWVSTSIESVSGARGAGLWTFYTAMLGLGGALLPPRLHRVAGAHAAVLAAVCIAVPIWQVVHVANLVGFEGWMPGPGLVVVFGGGVLAAVAAYRLVTAEVE